MGDHTVLSSWFQAEEAGYPGPPSKKFSACWSGKTRCGLESLEDEAVAGVDAPGGVLRPGSQEGGCHTAEETGSAPG